ncbi:Ubiquitin-conjugating enzyme E2 34 [Ancistrocladus abbreviatus]
MFLEYVEKYNQQQLSEQAEPEVSLVPAREEDPILPKARKLRSPVQENINRVEAQKERRNDGQQSFPTWFLLLLFTILGLVTDLPFNFENFWGRRGGNPRQEKHCGRILKHLS